MHKKYLSIKPAILLLFIAFYISANSQEAQLKLSGYEVHLTKARKPYQYRNEKNELMKADQAYLVLFNFGSRLKPTNSRIDFYIGDYRVPEYGGTKTGIYFRLYDPALLDKLNNQLIYWQYDNQQKTAFENKRFILNRKELKIEAEDSVLKKSH